MDIIGTDLLQHITDKAKNNPRLRMNHNLHSSLEAGAQRLLNALEPGTIIPIHRHPHTAETYIIIKGSIKLLFYNNDKILIDTVILSQSQGNYGVNIPIGQWHTIDVLESGSVIFEVKDGPYIPLTEENILH